MRWFLPFVLVACSADAPHATLVATAAEPPGVNCVSGGTAIESGVDANNNGILDASEIAATSYACQPAPPMLVAVASEPPGANCPRGGQAIQRGTDTNGNGVLDPGEVASTTYVCAESATLARIIAEPAGTHCAYGGQAIETGVDANGNGVLDAAEVTTTSYACNAAPAQLVSVTVEPAGTNCADGGEAIRTGPDANGNGILDPAEVATTSFACSTAGVANLVAVTAEPAGAHCPYGGQAITTGADANGDGVLEAGEVATTAYVCRSAPAELVDVASEPSGANCPVGGQRIRRGADANGNGVLDPAEIASTTYLCTALAASTLVRVTAEPPGAHCPYGGQQIATGADANGDGVLEASELLSTAYVCANGAAALVRVGAASAVACPTGGVSVDAGLDTNGNGVLDDVEVQSTRLLCNAPLPATLVGSFVVHNSADAAMLLGVTAITGDLTIDANGLDAIDLSSLQHVGGSISVAHYDGTTLDLPALTTVTDLHVEVHLTLLQLPVLASASNISIVADGFSAPALATVASLSDTVLTSDVSLLSLTHAGSLVLGGANATIHVALPALATAGDLDLNFAALTTNVLQHAAAVHVSSGTITTTALVDATDVVVGLDGALVAPALATLGSLTLQHLDLTGVQFAALTTITGDLETSTTGAFTFLLPSLTSIGGMWRQTTGEMLLNAPLLASIGSVTIGTVNPTTTPLSGGPTSLNLPSLQTTGLLRIDYNTRLTVITFPALTTVQRLEVVSNPMLVDLELPALTTILTPDTPGNQEALFISGNFSLDECVVYAILNQTPRLYRIIYPNLSNPNCP